MPDPGTQYCLSVQPNSLFNFEMCLLLMESFNDFQIAIKDGRRVTHGSIALL